ncbi:hypothetical protein SADUNF_Sadunf02G0108900 [Salix dunnii]|uniref:Uncharacterized protein n=1 Tax=Salix dunnii TaxID=1413687 RepID=A0A835TIX7_9ROSI|nr:hypothetical protein SADUNF_Sadunf02G0108900 [Salix dunnii]
MGADYFRTMPELARPWRPRKKLKTASSCVILGFHGVAAAVLWQSLRSVLSSANHEVRVGFELRVASLLVDIAEANASRIHVCCSFTPRFHFYVAGLVFQMYAAYSEHHLFNCPHFGSKLADMPWRLGLVHRPVPSIGELRSGSPRLVELNDCIRQLHKKGLVEVLSFCETKLIPFVEGYGGWNLCQSNQPALDLVNLLCV